MKNNFCLETSKLIIVREMQKIVKHLKLNHGGLSVEAKIQDNHITRYLMTPTFSELFNSKISG